jgi:hypothetical protein
MGVDLGSVSRDVHSCIFIGWDPAPPPIPPHLDSYYEGAIGGGGEGGGETLARGWEGGGTQTTVDTLVLCIVIPLRFQSYLLNSNTTGIFVGELLKKFKRGF